MNTVGKILSFCGRAARGIRRRCRKQYYRLTLAQCGRGCNFCDGVLIVEPEHISLGDYVNINEGVILQSCEDAAITIGSQVTISYAAMILTGGYDYTRGMVERDHLSSPVRIENSVWIGARAIILPGVRVGQGAVVAAGAVVARDVAPHTLVGGVPARLIKRIEPACSNGPEKRNF